MTTGKAVRFLDRTTPPHIMTLVLIAGLGALNMTAFLPALPAMTEYFGTEYRVMQLSVSLYLAVTAVIQLAIGPISDRFGRRRVNLIGTMIFVLATIGCTISPTVESFLAFRMIQASAAVGIVLSRAIVRDMVSQEESASMIGYVTMGMALVPMVAPVLGGAMEQAFGWQSIFIALTAVGIIVLVVCWADQGETARGGGRSFSDQAKDYPELFLSRRFWGYVLCSAFGSGVFFAFLGGAPFVATEVYGLSSIYAGLGFGAPSIGYAIGNGISGRYSVKYGINWMIKTGILLTLGGMVMALVLTAVGLGSAFVFFGFCTFVGLGNGMVIPNASAGMLSVRPHLAGTASGLGSAFMIGGGAAISSFTGYALNFGGGALPLIIIMTLAAFAALISILYVDIREKRMRRSGAS